MSPGARIKKIWLIHSMHRHKKIISIWNLFLFFFLLSSFLKYHNHSFHDFFFLYFFSKTKNFTGFIFLSFFLSHVLGSVKMSIRWFRVTYFETNSMYVLFFELKIVGGLFFRGVVNGILHSGLKSLLDDQRHIALRRQIGFFPKPKCIMNCKGINRHRQMFRMNLGKFLASGVIFEEWFIHVFSHLFWTGTVNLVNFFCVRVVGVQTSELALGITEKEQKVWTVASVNDV